MTLWISGLQGSNLRVREIEYRVDAAVLRSVAGDPTRDWSGQKYAIQHTFARSGSYWLSVRVSLEDGTQLTCEGFQVQINHVLEPWMLAAAGASGRNRVLGSPIKARATSRYSRTEAAKAAFDGREDTRWFSSTTDELPTLTLELLKPIRIRRIVLNQAVSRISALGLRDRILQVRIRINQSKKDTLVTLNRAILQPTVVELPRRTSINTLEIEVIERAHEGLIDAVGFSEVALEE